MMDRPELMIETSSAGVRTIIVRVAPGQRDPGLDFLQRLLPAIRVLDKFSRRMPDWNVEMSEGEE